MPKPRTPKKVLLLTKTVRGQKILGTRSDDLVPTLKRGTEIGPPAKLKTDYAKSQWTVVTNELINLEVLAIQDLPTLEQAFVMLDEFHNTLDSIHKIRDAHEGPIVDPKDIDTLHKLSSILIKVTGEYNRILYRFGITPAERAKMQFNKEPNINPIETLLAGD